MSGESAASPAPPLSANSTAFSLPAAVHLADLAAAAYLGADAAEGAAVGAGYAGARLVDGGGSTQVLVAWTDAHLVAAFRGTEWNRLGDWCADGAACLTGGPGGERVHRGFLRALGEVERPLEAALRDLGAGRALWLCGHSLGGALALLAGAYLVLDADRPLWGAYSYGAPRAGSRAFADLLDRRVGSRIWRVARAGDPVPRLPPRIARYSHAGSDVFLTADGRLVLDPAGWLRELSSIEADLEALAHLDPAGISEHRVAGYRSALAAVPAA